MLPPPPPNYRLLLVITYSDQTQFLLAPTAVRPVTNYLLSICGPLENTALLKCPHPHCIALSFNIISLILYKMTDSIMPRIRKPSRSMYLT
jgi:hypothetical protein